MNKLSIRLECNRILQFRCPNCVLLCAFLLNSPQRQYVKLKAAIDTYLNSVKTLCPLVTTAELDYLMSGLTVSQLKPKHFYIHAGTIQREIGFVFSGLLRTFYIDQEGNQISVNFVRENRYITHYPAFITQTPSKYYFQCIEPTIVVNLPYKHIQEGLQQVSNFGTLWQIDSRGSFESSA